MKRHKGINSNWNYPILVRLIIIRLRIYMQLYTFYFVCSISGFSYPPPVVAGGRKARGLGDEVHPAPGDRTRRGGWGAVAIQPPEAEQDGGSGGRQPSSRRRQKKTGGLGAVWGMGGGSNPH